MKHWIQKIPYSLPFLLSSPTFLPYTPPPCPTHNLALYVTLTIDHLLRYVFSEQGISTKYVTKKSIVSDPNPTIQLRRKKFLLSLNQCKFFWNFWLNSANFCQKSADVYWIQQISFFLIQQFFVNFCKFLVNSAKLFEIQQLFVKLKKFSSNVV